MKKSNVSNLTIVMVSIVLVIFALEVFLRVQSHQRREYYKSHYWSNVDEVVEKDADEEILYHLKPGTHDAFGHETFVNSQGYRDDEHMFQKKEGVFRIVMIGDSVTYGYAIDFAESFTQKLERMLNENIQDKNFEVIVLAQPSYTITQEYRVLEKQAYKYNPDLIIWNYVLNDPAHPYLHDDFGNIASYIYEPDFYIGELVRRSVFYYTESQKAKELDCLKHKDFSWYMHCVYYDKVEENFRKIGELNNSEEVPILVTIHPNYAILPGDKLPDSFDNYFYEDLHNILKKTFESNGLHTLDLLDDLREQNPNDVAFDLVHPNNFGNTIISQSIYNYLIENDLIH